MSTPFDLDPAAWTRLRELLGQALALEGLHRDKWLAALPAADAALVPRLRALLAHAAQSEHHANGQAGDGASAPIAARLMNTLPKVETCQFAAPLPVAVPAELVGPYRLLRELGHGGMASVWLAERTDVLQGRLSAVKLPLGAWHGAGLAERLARERAILATLNHPNIATLYDAGVDAAGRPWLALEYVEGERIDAYAARLALDVQARLRLFLQVVRAVAYAHGRLVVHRDLKPANILVTDRSQVKLLDFGIAKLLGDDLAAADATELSRQTGRVLTPDYAAPEQIAGLPLGTACDIYALGVVLYELLAGERPYRLPVGSSAALEKAVLELQPRPPSQRTPDASRARALRGDLDTIVLKALMKQPAERYASAEALAEDIERHLRREPVLARPASNWYRIQRFVERRRLAVGAAATLSITVLGGAAAAIWQADLARNEQRRAEEVKRFIAGLFADADPWRAQRTKPDASHLLRRARERVNREFAERPSLRVELLNVIGASLTALEDFPDAQATLLAAADLADRTLPTNDELRVRSHFLLGELYLSSQRTPELKVELQRLLPLLHADEARNARDLVYALHWQVQVDNDEGLYKEMEATARRALSIAAARLQPDDPAQVLARRSLANALENQGLTAAARAESTDAFALSSRIFVSEPKHPLHNDTRFVHARILSAAGEHEAALPLMGKSIEVASEFLGSDSLQVATMLREMVSPMMETHRLREGLAVSQRALRILEKHHREDSVHLAYARVALGTIERELRQGDCGHNSFATAVRALAQELGADHAYTLDVRANAALGLALADNATEAAGELDAIAARFRASGQPTLDKVTVYRALAHRKSGRAKAAAVILQAALATLTQARELERARLEMAQIHLALDEPGKAADLLRLLPPREASLRPAHAEADIALGRARLALGDGVQAIAYFQRADEFWRGFDPSHREARAARTWLARAHNGRDSGSGARSERHPT